MNKMIKTIAIFTVTALLLGGCSATASTASPSPSASAPATETPTETSAPTQSPTASAESTAPSSTEAPVAQSENTKPAEIRQFASNSPQGWSADFQVISSNKGNILIDPGKYDDEVANYIESIGGIDAIMITHGHWDKLRGLDEAMAENPDAVVYIHELDQPYLLDPVRNCSIEDGFKGTTQAKTTTLVEGTYDINGYSVKLIHLPGHTEGSSVFYFPDENLFIGGDAIMANLVGSSKHPGGNEDDRQASIVKFKALTFPNDMRIYHGHGTNTTYEEMMKTNVDLK